MYYIHIGSQMARNGQKKSPDPKKLSRGSGPVDIFCKFIPLSRRTMTDWYNMLFSIPISKWRKLLIQEKNCSQRHSPAWCSGLEQHLSWLCQPLQPTFTPSCHKACTQRISRIHLPEVEGAVSHSGKQVLFLLQGMQNAEWHDVCGHSLRTPIAKLARLTQGEQKPKWEKGGSHTIPVPDILPCPMLKMTKIGEGAAFPHLST